MGFQGQVNAQQAIGVVGDFISANPRSFYVAGAFGLVAGSQGVTIGNFAWVSPSYLDGDNGPAIVNSFGSGPVGGFIHRAQQGLIGTSNWLADSGLTILGGYEIECSPGGDFLCKNSGSTYAQVGQKAYANFLTGAVSFAVTGSPTTASATLSTIAAGTAATFTGTIVNNVLTASSVTNTIYPGAVLSGTGVTTGTVIVSQLTGTTGGAGTYALSIPGQSVTAGSLTATPNVLDTTGGTVTGTIVVGSTVTSSGGTNTGTVVGMGVYATYATGKYVVAPAIGATAAGAATSGTIVLASNVETKWIAVSAGAAGEVIKISSHPLG